MSKMWRIAVIMVAALVLLLGFGTQPARAEEIRCIGTLGAITVDNVLVPEGKTCTLNKTRVQGTVQVARNATLYAKTARINGHVQAENAKLVSVTANTTVGGSIQAFENTGGVVIKGNRVDGNLQCKSNIPAPTGGGNIVQGNKEDQCARL